MRDPKITKEAAEEFRNKCKFHLYFDAIQSRRKNCSTVLEEIENEKGGGITLEFKRIVDHHFGSYVNKRGKLHIAEVALTDESALELFMLLAEYFRCDISKKIEF
jgi:hypothetical protein